MDALNNVKYAMKWQEGAIGVKINIGKIFLNIKKKRLNIFLYEKIK